MITASEKAHYDSLFRQYDTDEDGLVGGVDVKEVFLKTGLPQHTLAHIWWVVVGRVDECDWVGVVGRKAWLVVGVRDFWVWEGDSCGEKFGL